MLKVYNEEVQKELNSVVSIITDDMTDISRQFQLVLVLPYIVDGKILEILKS